MILNLNITNLEFSAKINNFLIPPMNILYFLIFIENNAPNQVYS